MKKPIDDATKESMADRCGAYLSKELKKGSFCMPPSYCIAANQATVGGYGVPMLISEEIPEDEVWFVHPLTKFELNEEASDNDTGTVIFDVEHEVLGKLLGKLKIRKENEDV